MLSLADIKDYNNGRVTLSHDEAYEFKNKIDRTKLNGGFMVEGIIYNNEIEAYKVIKDVILPSLHLIAKTNNPLMYTMYQGNLCRHATFFTTYFLKGIMPDWTWEMYEMDYSAEIMGKKLTTTHAFIIGEKDGEFRAIDMWDKYMPQIWASVNEVEYPVWIHGAEENKEILDIRPLDYDYYMSVTNEPLMGNTKSVMSIMDNVIGGYKSVRG
jgi:hypothetical protein